MDFLHAYSHYADAFLTERSVLTSSLFPEKPAQMWFGYRYSGPVLARLTGWLEHRIAPEDFGDSLRSSPLAPVNGLHLGAIVWSYSLALLGEVLANPESPAADLDELPNFAGYWARVHRAYRRRPLPFDAESPLMTDYQVLSDSARERIEGALVRIPDGHALQRLLGALTVYAWLLEAESRQGVFSSGLYPAQPGAIHIRCFNDLSGSAYEWAPSVATVPRGQLAIVLQLEGVEAKFDLFGRAKLKPEDYGDRILAAAVLTEDGPIADLAAWIADSQNAVRMLHRDLYRTVAGWDRRGRFIAGVTSYGKLWAAFVLAAGGSPADEAELVWTPLRSFVDSEIDRISTDEPIPLWDWVRGPRAQTLFEPILAPMRSRAS
jgi:hypothetical protein